MARFLPSPVERARPRQGSRRLAVTCRVTARQSAEAPSVRSGGADLRRCSRLSGEAQEGLTWYAVSPGRTLGNTCRTVRRFSPGSPTFRWRRAAAAAGPPSSRWEAAESAGSKCNFTRANDICCTAENAPDRLPANLAIVTLLSQLQFAKRQADWRLVSRLECAEQAFVSRV